MNTHERYLAFRLEGARLRKARMTPSGALLADELAQYSERRDDYIKDNKNPIRVSKLADGAVPTSAYESTDAGG